jgi:hypothetical protein
VARRVRNALALGACLAIAAVSHAHAQLIARLPIERVIADLTRPDAHVREEAARALACTGPRSRVVPELVRALVGEAVPETRAALVLALARRGDETAVPVLEATWDHATPVEREHILDGLAAIGTSDALGFVADRLASDLHRPGACERLGRSAEGIALVAAALVAPERRDPAALCLAQLATDERAVTPLLVSAPTLAPLTIVTVLDALEADPRILSLAAGMLEAGDTAVVNAALAVLARRAPDRVPLDRWQTLAAEPGEARASAIVALTQLDPALAEPLIARVIAEGGASATQLFDALRRAPLAPPTSFAAFVALEATHARALDRLATLPGGGEVLATLGASPDVLGALAIAAALDPQARALLFRSVEALDPASRRTLLVAAGALDREACATGESIEERRATAYCLSRAPSGGALASARLETERDPSVVGWLALAATEPPSVAALGELLALDGPRLAVLHLLPRAMQRATAAERRRLEAQLVLSTRAARASERAEAVRALGALGDERHRARIALALEDEAASVRTAAARALVALPAEPVSEIRRAGRARIEHEDDVRAALAGIPLALAAAPLRLRVDVRGEASPESEVEIALASGQVLVLAPAGGEIVLFGVPDRTAHVRLVDPERD